MPKMFSKIKVLHVSATSTGGIGSNLLLLAKYLPRHEIELYFAIPPDSHFYSTIDKTYGNVFPLKIDRKPFIIKNLVGCYQLWKLTKNKKYDIVHCHTSVGGVLGRLIAKINHTKTIWSMHGWAFNYPINKGPKKWFYRNIEKVFDRITDHFVGISRNMIDIALNARITTPKKITLIYHGIEMSDTCLKNNKRKELGIGEDTVIIGAAGRFEPQKAFDILLKASASIIEQYKDVKFIILGDGPLRNYLESLSKQYDLNQHILFLGWKTNVIEYLKIIDIFCQTSIWEALPIILLEVMSLGKPIVATDVGGVRELFKDGDGGFLIPAESPKSAAKALSRLITDKELRQTMSKKNRERINKVFNLEQMIKKYECLYKRLYRQ